MFEETYSLAAKLGLSLAEHFTGSTADGSWTIIKAGREGLCRERCLSCYIIGELIQFFRHVSRASPGRPQHVCLYSYYNGNVCTEFWSQDGEASCLWWFPDFSSRDTSRLTVQIFLMNKVFTDCHELRIRHSCSPQDELDLFR